MPVKGPKLWLISSGVAMLSLTLLPGQASAAPHSSQNSATTSETTQGYSANRNVTQSSQTPSAPAQPWPNAPAPGLPSTPQQSQGFRPYADVPTEKLRVRVIDGRTLQPLKGTEVVIAETEQRVTTNGDGYTPWINVPVLRSERFRPLVAELHGQLTAIAYKNGYRDSIHMGIRIHDGVRSETTIWMYKISPEDRRIEPVLYQVPYHHLWLIQLADKFRRPSQLGEGWQRP